MLDIQNAGIEVDKRGKLSVGQKLLHEGKAYLCPAAHVVGFPALASTSMEQGRHAALHAFGARDESTIPDVYPLRYLYNTEISTVGATVRGTCQEKHSV